MATFSPLSYSLLDPVPALGQSQPTCLTVDPFSDILWAGTTAGGVQALVNPQSLTQSIKFVAHGRPSQLALTAHPGVLEVRVTDREIWTLTDGGVGGRRRGGAPRWNVSEPLRTLRSMCPNPMNSHEVLAGGSGQAILANISKGEIVKWFDLGGTVVKLAPMQRNAVVATQNGQVSLVDSRTGFRPVAGVAPARAHSGGLSGADVQGHAVITWGWTHLCVQSVSSRLG